MAVLRVRADNQVSALNSLALSLLSKAGLTSTDETEVNRLLAPLTSMQVDTTQRVEVTLPHSQRRLEFQTSKPAADGSRLVVFADVTGQEQMRHERDRLLQLASLSEVMPSILHELKNPLAGIGLALELLVEDSRGELQEKLHAILSEVRRLGLTLDGLGRFQREVRSARHVAIDLAIREAVALLAPQAAARGIDTRVEVADMPLLPFEAAAIRSVIFNTMMNAIHACKAGQCITVKASFDRAESTLHLEIADTGSGMSPEVLARATDMFFTTKPKGSGIGLALCKGVADAVQGTFEVTSSPGRGTCIRLSLPTVEKAL